MILDVSMAIIYFQTIFQALELFLRSEAAALLVSLLKFLTSIRYQSRDEGAS